MSGKQRAVLWLGIILITLNLVSKWSELKGVIFKSASAASPAVSPATTFPFNLLNSGSGNSTGVVNNTPATTAV